MFASIFGLFGLKSFKMGEELPQEDHFFKEPPDTKLAVLGEVRLTVADTYSLEGDKWILDNVVRNAAMSERFSQR
jgi:hypothetical protein